MEPYLASLNPAQREAVTTIKGPLLIVAGAGAGKTKTLTHRILHLIRNGVAPEQILAVTFTNKAAKEMNERVQNLLSGSDAVPSPISLQGRPCIKTFHSLGVQILREHSQKLGLKRHFTIFDKDDSKKAVKNAMRKCGVDPKEVDPQSILSFISKQKGEGRTLRDIVGKASSFLSDIGAKVWEHYERQLKEEGALDFDDLLLVTYTLLRDNPEIRNSYQKRWPFVHIDEYQDTNGVQYRIASELIGPEKNICVVGDSDQTIYTWRGANMRNILDFEKDYPEAKVVLLEQNYRSTKTIIGAANDIISKNEVRKVKNLFTQNPEGEKITIYTAYDEAEEAGFIAKNAKDLVKNGALPSSIAVLFRANFQSRVLEEAFLSADVPYQILGTRFFERKEVKDVLSYIRIALNPDSRADLVRVINEPRRGIGKVTLLKIVEGKRGDLPVGTQQKVAGFFAVLEKIKAKSESLTPSELIKFTIIESGLEDALNPKHEDDVERIENMRELATLAKRYDHLTGTEGIEALLDDAALMSDQDNLESNEGGVKLMTVHASKGLEFDYVFISGLEEELFPHRRMNEAGVSEEEREEERRLMYVAVTRAKKKLFLTYAMSRTLFGSTQFNVPSQFIADINLAYTEAFEEPPTDRDEARRQGIESIFDIDF
jgi:DNA helicase-2/ATP-dependent DNA helicase PcrA